jgi:hypothetical protein
MGVAEEGVVGVFNSPFRRSPRVPRRRSTPRAAIPILIGAVAVLAAVPAQADPCSVLDVSCVADAATGAVDDATDAVDQAVDDVTDPVGGVTDPVDDVIGAVDDVTGVVEDATDPVVDVVDETVNDVVEAVEGILGPLPDLPDIPEIPDLPDLPGVPTVPGVPVPPGAAAATNGPPGSDEGEPGSGPGPFPPGADPRIGEPAGVRTAGVALRPSLAAFADRTAGDALARRGFASPATDGGLGGALADALRVLAFPLALALIVAAFVIVQHRLDRRDPKLALAPVGPDVLAYV